MRYYDIYSEPFMPFITFDLLLRTVKKRIARIASYRTRNYRSFDRIIPTIQEEKALFHFYRESRRYNTLYGGRYPIA